MTLGFISSVAGDVGVSRGFVVRVAASAAKRYKVFRIPKRSSGKFRHVAQPAREVKAIQRSIVERLSPRLPVHERATAYKTGSSILSNADAHSGARYILKLDFKNFFQSIDAYAITKHLQAHFGDDLSPVEIKFILDACLWRSLDSYQFGLCIGAPSSPFLSNTVMYGFDVRVSEYCASKGVEYTRYSDDITLSTVLPEVLQDVERVVRSICAENPYPNLTFNDEKRVSVGRGAAFRVTGLTLTNQGGVSVGRVRKRGVRAGVNDFVRGRLGIEQVEKLKGEIAFVLSVEPSFAVVLTRTYGSAIAYLLPKPR